jgi:potassium channel subfamily K
MGVLEPNSDEDEPPVDGDGIPRPPTSRSFEEWRDGNGSPDWLHGKNPLNNSEELTEWMLFTMVEKLEMELADLRSQLGNKAVTPVA